MTKTELVNTFYRLDKEKFKLLQKGVSFELIIHENGGYLHTGIGTGEDMSMMVLYSLLSLFQTGKSDSIEAFADSVRDGIIEAYTKDVFKIQEFEGGYQE